MVMVMIECRDVPSVSAPSSWSDAYRIGVGVIDAEHQRLFREDAEAAIHVRVRLLPADRARFEQVRS